MDKNFLDKNTDKLFCLAEENLTLVYAVKSIKKNCHRYGCKQLL